MQRPKLKPIRMCLGCNQRDAQAAMVRIAVDDNVPVVDTARRLAGRGGYLHRGNACLEQFARSKVKTFRSLRRALSSNERRQLIDSIGAGAGQLKTAGIR